MSREVGSRLSRRVERDGEDVGSGSSSGDFPGGSRVGLAEVEVQKCLAVHARLGPTRVRTVWKLCDVCW